MFKEKRNIIIAICIVVAVLLIALGVGIFIKNKAKNNQEVEIYEEPVIEDIILLLMIISHQF